MDQRERSSHKHTPNKREEIMIMKSSFTVRRVSANGRNEDGLMEQSEKKETKRACSNGSQQREKDRRRRHHNRHRSYQQSHGGASRSLSWRPTVSCFTTILSISLVSLSVVFVSVNLQAVSLYHEGIGEGNPFQQFMLPPVVNRHQSDSSMSGSSTRQRRRRRRLDIRSVYHPQRPLFDHGHVVSLERDNSSSDYGGLDIVPRGGEGREILVSVSDRHFITANTTTKEDKQQRTRYSRHCEEPDWHDSKRLNCKFSVSVKNRTHPVTEISRNVSHLKRFCLPIGSDC